jgi:hypothetical protein
MSTLHTLLERVKH